MKKTLSLFLIILMMAGLDAVALEDFGSPLAFTGGPGSSTYLEWNDHSSSTTDTSKKRRKKKRKKSKGKGKKGGGAFEQGAMIPSLGYGMPNITHPVIFIDYLLKEDYKVNDIGTIHAKFEYAVSNRIGIGLSFNTAITSVTYAEKDFYGTGNVDYYAFDYFGLASNCRFNWHFVSKEKFSIYTGLGLGYNLSNYKFSTTKENATDPVLVLSPIGFEWSVGSRFMFNDFIGAYVELGYFKSIAQLGVCFKF